ncbi:hypothetical protein GDO81_022026 [Engystomops pustulosus]|uniref:Hepcidin n=1 Tax=Engystomops pustulosus TaxID=76066 RepID=A0AAV6Z6D8_ENGPU|nr:hypothetical protein GDO81_022026 [Engystomops pustulosus]
MVVELSCANGLRPGHCMRLVLVSLLVFLGFVRFMVILAAEVLSLCIGGSEDFQVLHRIVTAEVFVTFSPELRKSKPFTLM